MPDATLNAYRASLPVNANSGKIAAFLARKLAKVTVVRKNREKEIDVRPLVQDLRATDPETVELQLRTTVSTPGIKPLEFFAWLFDLTEEQVYNTRIVKIWSRAEQGPGTEE